MGRLTPDGDSRFFTAPQPQGPTPPPLVKGGQGRDAAGIQADALVSWLALAASVIAVGLIVLLGRLL